MSSTRGSTEPPTAADPDGQAANLLGAISLAVTDRMGDAVTRRAGSVSDATALSALHHFLVAPSIDLLAQTLGLSSSGTVRLVDRLVTAGLVRRRPDGDARTTVVALTASGRRRAREITRARHEVLESALAALPADDRRRFGELAGRVLAGMIRPPGATRWTCRLCDTTACGRPEGQCPVAGEAERRYGG
jgi:DNA-binding MarR family transcriptional regulator